MLCQFSHCRYLFDGKVWQVKWPKLKKKKKLPHQLPPALTHHIYIYIYLENMSIFFRKPNQIFLVWFRILLIYGNLSLSLPLTGTMDTLENMWNKLSLLDSKENSVQCSEDSLARQRSRLLLVAKFITKLLTNIESVAHFQNSMENSEGD